MTQTPPTTPTPRASGRKPKLNRFLIDQAETLLKNGLHQKATCAILRISQTTWYRWLQEAETSKPGTTKWEFRETVTRARALAEESAVKSLREAWEGSKETERDWRAAAFFLERSFPDRWGRKHLLVPEQGEVDKDSDALAAAAVADPVVADHLSAALRAAASRESRSLKKE